MNNLIEDPKVITTSTITPMMDQMNNSKSSSYHKYSPKSQDNTTVVPDNRRAPPFYGGYYTKIGGIWTIKHEIISPKFYELLVKTELKGENYLDIKTLYNHINMCSNAVTRL